MSIAETNSLEMRSLSALSDDVKKWKVAQDFEALFVNQMLKSMRNTVPKDENMSSGRRIFTEMLDEQIANTASRTGNFGLAQMIYKELAGKDATNPQKIMSMQNAYNWQPTKASEKQIETWISEAAETMDLDKNLIRAVIQQESAGNSLARSSKGAKGLMQLMDSTAKDMGVVNPYNGRQNIMGGAKYLKQLLAQFNGDESKALAAYNAGPSRVEQYNGIPPFKETQDYVKNVLQYKEQFSQEEAL